MGRCCWMRCGEKAQGCRYCAAHFRHCCAFSTIDARTPSGERSIQLSTTGNVPRPPVRRWRVASGALRVTRSRRVLRQDLDERQQWRTPARRDHLGPTPVVRASSSGRSRRRRLPPLTVGTQSRAGGSFVDRIRVAAQRWLFDQATGVGTIDISPHPASRLVSSQ